MKRTGDRTQWRALFAAALAWLGLAACTAGSGDGLDENGRPLSEGGGNVPLGPNFDSIQANVFTPTCAVAGCHVGAAAPEGLDLSEYASYALLVTIASNQVPALLRVAPGDPDASYLIQKLEGTAAGGQRMPLSGPPFVPQSTTDVIRQWITDGALPGAGSGGPPTVVATDPADGAVLDQLPVEITATFTQDMDGTLVSNATVVLQRSGGDGSFADGNEVTITPASVALSPGNDRLLVLDMAGVPFAADDYELRLVGTGATALASSTGVLLDGDEDGTAGGDFTSGFRLAAVLPTLASIQDNVFTPTCATAGCHEGPQGPSLPAGQDLSSAAASLASLVNVTSEREPPLLRVEPFNADDSYIIRKLEGNQVIGFPMPLGGGPLPQSTIDAIRAWIDAGARP
ncbi:MAG: Ig-like domain-containing protein [Chromatiales bacterium]|nr:MAG: Ig-like domain-containing protein [Chromatiales bacterium]